MVKSRLRQYPSILKGISKRQLMLCLVVLGVGLLGVVALRFSDAASFNVAAEAEAGVKSGNLSAGETAGASGNASVRFGGGGTNPGPAATYPLKVSPDKRHLTGSNGTPYFMIADTAWSLSTSRMSEADVIRYLDARKSQGFNTVLTSMIDITNSGLRNTRNGAGVSLASGGFGAPNAAYFTYIKRVFQLANERGMQLAILPAWLQWAVKDSSHTTGNMDSYGRFVATQLKDVPNLIWIMGGDWGGTPEGNCPAQPQVRALANAIEAVDTSHLITYHPGSDLSSSSCYNNDAWLDFNGSYWDFNYNNLSSTYRNLLRDYNTSPIRPAINLETCYEGPWGEAPDDNCTALRSRMQSAHQVLAGGLGFSYGSNGTYSMDGKDVVSWQQAIANKGGTAQGNIAKAFSTRQWTKLVPDQNRSVLTAGNGSPTDADYAAAARATDGSLVMAYTPNAKTLTIDMAKLSAPATARWYDPLNGQYRAISGSPFANSGSRQFATPGKNSNGEPDWMLIIETSAVQ